MKKIFFTVAVLCLIVLSSHSSNAQQVGKFSFGGSLGVGKVTSGGSDVLISMDLNTLYRADKNWAVLGVTSYSTQSLYSFVEVTGNGRYYANPTEKVKFFGEGGVGIYSVRTEFFGLVAASKSYFGINIGGGISSTAFNKVDMTLKAKYHNPLMGSDGKVNYFIVSLGANVLL
jgi:hypothetical protein